MTELEYEWEYYMHPGTFYDGTLMLQVPGRVEQAIKESKRKEPKMTNAEWMQKNGIKFKSLRVERENGNMYTVVIEGKGRMDGGTWVCADNKIKAILQWLDKEHKEPVLDEAERKYLSTVIKPFRNRVRYISKTLKGNNIDECIVIQIKPWSFGGVRFDNYTFMPPFKVGTMYQGMKTGREYTLEELGL